MTRSETFGTASNPYRDFARRRAAEALGLLTLAGCVALGLALLTWSVRDPSFNQATDAKVRNLLGLPGAVIADLFMQLIGVATSAALMPIAALGVRLLSHRGVERGGLRFCLWLIGIVCAATAASLLPVTDRWPLPSGLGGIVGDAILSVPRHALGGNRLVLALIGLCAIGGAILTLTGAAGYGFESEADIRRESREQARESQPSPRGLKLSDDRDDEDDTAGEPGSALVTLGALLHVGLTIQAFLRRGWARARASAPEAAAEPSFDARLPPEAERREPIFEDADEFHFSAPQRRAESSVQDAPPRSSAAAPAQAIEPGSAVGAKQPIRERAKTIRAGAPRRGITNSPPWNCSPSRKNPPARPRCRRTRSRKTRAFSKACWTIFRCAAKLLMCDPAPS